MAFDPKIPYNNLPDLPPKQQIETHRILKKAISANKALADLRGAGHLLPNQAVLIQALGLQEAKSSAEIENIVTTNDDLYRAFVDESLKMNAETKEVLSYKDALWHGFNALKNKRILTTPLYEELVQIVKGNSNGIRKNLGTKLANAQGHIVYTPPEGENIIRQKLDNLARFIYSPDEWDPLVKMAIIHYQFEAIHPFSDGNGRVGRILNMLYLIDKGLLDIPVLYLSRYILDHKLEYYLGLRAVTEKEAWEPWILYMLEGIEQTAMASREKIFAIHELFQSTATDVRAKAPHLYSKDLIEVLFRNPYCKISTIEEAGLGKRQTASKILQELERIGILRSLKRGRHVYYLNDRFYQRLKQ